MTGLKLRGARAPPSGRRPCAPGASCATAVAATRSSSDAAKTGRSRVQPQSVAGATPQSLRGQPRPLGKRPELGPYHARMNLRLVGRSGREPAVSASNHVFAPDQPCVGFDLIGNELRMLDEAIPVAEHARDDDLVAG